MKKVIVSLFFLFIGVLSYAQCGVTLPVNQTVCLDDTYTITTSLATGMTATGYKWFKNATEITGEINATLDVVANVDGSGANIPSNDLYRVEVTATTCVVGSPATDTIRIIFIDVLATQPLEYNICDNNLDGDDANGFAEFDFALVDPQVLDTLNAADYTITYHNDQADADSGAAPLTIPPTTTFTNTVADNQEVFIRLESNVNTSCYDTTSVQLFVRPLPVVNSPVAFLQCDDHNDPTDTVSRVDLSEINEHINTDTTTVFTYYPTLLDAQNDTNVLTNGADFTVNLNVQMFARTTTTYGCFRISEINIAITNSQIPNTVLYEYIQCDDLVDDNDDANLINTFNLGASITVLRDTYFGGNPNIIINYYENITDATLENNAIADPFHYRNLVPVGHDMTLPVTQDIFIRVDNVLNDECYGLGHHITLTVNPLPAFELIFDEYLCVANTNIIITDFDNSSANFTFLWTKEDILVGSTTLGTDENLDITTAGNYTLTITNQTTMCSRTKEFEVLESQIPTLKQLEIVSFNKPNNQVIFTMLGSGDYEYALDNTIFDATVAPEDDRAFQDSSLFEHLNGGEYVVTVRDKNLCGAFRTTFVVLDYKPFFTPNGDGINESWTVTGLDLYPLASLTIFDRFGKVLTNLTPSNPSWNGIYKGKIMKDSDYWFLLEYVNILGEENSYNGHFSLKTIK